MPFFLVSLALALTSPLLSAPAPENGELIICFRKDAAPAEIARITRIARLNVGRHVRTRAMARKGHPGLAVGRTALNPKQALAILRKEPAVAYAEPNYALRSFSTSNDPIFTSGNLWGMAGDLSTPANIYGSQAAEAWSAGYVGSRSVYVAVIDDGVQIDHPELQANIWTNPFDPADGIDNDGNGYPDDLHGWNFASESNTLFEDQNNHGTHVAGTIGAEGGNGTGVAGVNWRVTMIPLKFLSNGTGNTLDAVEAIDYCVDLKTRHGLNLVAINASWGSDTYSTSLHEAVLRAVKAGILFVAAAGNAEQNNDLAETCPANLDTRFGTLNEEPAGFNGVITVAAIDQFGALAPFSNYGGRKVHIGAPGELIYSTYPTNLIAGLNGTSMAAPHVSGAVALYASTHPAASPSQIREAILASAIPTPSLAGKTATGGRLNLSSIIPPGPVLAPVAAILSAETWTNGAVDPGELVTMQLTITNSSASTTNLVATLFPGGGVLNPSSSQVYGALAAGGSAVARSFSFTADGTCGGNIQATLLLSDGAANLGSITFAIPLGAPTNLFAENFNSVIPPALPPGWTSTLTGTGPLWNTITLSPGNNAVYAPNTGGFADNSLTSPVVRIHSASARLSFTHRFNTEPEWDGGVLEISIGGDAFVDILEAGGTFLTNGYNWRLQVSSVPLGARDAWSGNSGSFIETIVQLPAVCLNRDIQLRWRAGSDTTIGGSGWYLDSVALVDGYSCCLPDQTLAEDTGPINVPFNIGTALSEPGLTLEAFTSNETLLPAANLAFSGAFNSRTLQIFPGTNEFGSGTVTIQVQTDWTTTYKTFQVTLTPVNDAPRFTKGPDIQVAQDAPAQTFPNWAQNIAAGPANESDQTFHFELISDNGQLFSVPPAIASDGTLTFTPATHQRGAANITVTLFDTGGTANSGQEQTIPQSFNISVGQSIDSDGDGVPDDYELAFGLNPGDGTDGATDLDGDGFSNYNEFLAGTDPSDPRSLLRFFAPEIGGFADNLRFSSVAGRSYSVEENTNFPSATWDLLGVSTGTGSLFTQATSGGNTTASRRIYRVRAVAGAETISSEYAGTCALPLIGDSDTFVSVPFTRSPAEFGAIAAIAGSVITLRGNPEWAPNAWVYGGAQTNTYYILLRSGALEGEYFTIAANTGNTLTLQTEGADLSSLAIGDAIAIIPYWTLGTVFPGGAGIHSSTSPGARTSEVLFPNLQGSGINLSAGATYYFWAGAWRKIGEGAIIKNDDVILPEMPIIVRNNSSIGTTLFTEGFVVPGKIRSYVRRNPGARQDNSLALIRPMFVSLDNSGLVSSGAFRASPSPGGRLDELLVFNNTIPSKNKSAAATYYYWAGGWRKIGSGGTDVGADLAFSPGSAVILRSASAPSPAVWENLPGY